MSSGAPESSPREINARAVRAMTAGDFAAARALLAAAAAEHRSDVPLWLNLAAACRATGDLPAALAAVEHALRAEPRSFLALLMQGSLIEATGDARKAAGPYGAALALAPPEDRLDAATRGALQRARAAHRRYVDECAAFLHAELGPGRARGNSDEAERAAAFVDLLLQRRTHYRQEPTEFFYPGLPAIEFWSRAEFPWLETFERATVEIREELRALLRDELRDFVPYVAYPDSVPLDQWAELNQSRRWSALHLHQAGAAVAANAGRCPRTMAAIEPLPQPRMPGRSPAAMFSALQPKTRIPPHTGVANTRLVVHLPLIVPSGCRFRVGNETRTWREGEAWVFDDTIEHEAWNDSDELRVILICDVWNPRLSGAERDNICAVVAALDRFNGGAPAAGL